MNGLDNIIEEIAFYRRQGLPVPAMLFEKKQRAENAETAVDDGDETPSPAPKKRGRPRLQK